MRFCLIAYPQKPLIIAQSAVSRGTRCLKVVRSLLQLAYFAYASSKNPGEVRVHAGSSEPLPHADVIRTNISCADQFIVHLYNASVINFIVDHYFLFLFSMIILI